MKTATEAQGPRAAGAMLWLVLLIPALTVVAGVSTVVIASRSGSSDAVIDPVTRTAQVQDRDLRADQRAAALSLQARVHLDPESGALRLHLDGRAAVDAPLHLHVAHPVRRSLDLDVILVPAGEGLWLGRLQPFDAGHDWNLVLRPEDDAWRLIGRFIADQVEVRLTPALTGGGVSGTGIDSVLNALDPVTTPRLQNEHSVLASAAWRPQSAASCALQGGGGVAAG